MDSHICSRIGISDEDIHIHSCISAERLNASHNLLDFLF